LPQGILKPPEDVISSTCDTPGSANKHVDSPQTHPQGTLIVTAHNELTEPPPTEPTPARVDAVEIAIATALEKAAQAGEWATVALLAKELEARRKSHADPKVIPIRSAKKDTP
jgi:hypothetical protein